MGRKVKEDAVASRYEQAELLTALWRLGAGENDMMPTSHGILDRALEAVKDELPPELSSLTFSSTSVGLRCYELPDILLAAQEALLTSEPNPTYLSTIVTIKDQRAAEIAVMHGLKIRDARTLGDKLRGKVDEMRGDGWRSTMVA
jgi:hypothetical protein